MHRIFRILTPFLILTLGVVSMKVLLATGPKPELREPTAHRPAVLTSTMVASDHALRLPAYGEMQARAETAIVAELSGRVVEVSESLRPGARFQAGDVLVRLERADSKDLVTAAQARLQQARAQLTLEQAASDAAVADWKANRQEEVPALVARRPQLEAAEAATRMAETELAIAKRNLERTVLVAPFDGRCVRRQVEVGSWTAPGAVLGLVHETRMAEVAISVPQTQFWAFGWPRQEGGPPIEVEIRSAGDEGDAVWKGNLVRMEPHLDPRNRMATAIVEIPDPFDNLAGGPALSPGMFVSAEIHGRTLHSVYRIPRSALHDGDRVRLVDVDGKAHSRKVETVHSTPTHLLVRGLQDGELLILSPISIFLEGMDVQRIGQDEAR